MSPRRRRALTYSLYGIAALLVALAAGARSYLRGRPAPPPRVVEIVKPPEVKPPLVEQAPPDPPKPVEVPQVEVVFALDTTSSMTGLIDGAKRKIWSLVNFISTAQPQPHVRIGLVAYRDIGDDYVTRFFDLSDDLDEVFRHLTHFRAEGGGDTPEHVAKALHDAVVKPSWTQGDKVARIIYLVGDAPPHYDYDDGFKVDAIARRAADKGIHVNTIRCGDDPETASAFRKIASLGKGQFSTVDQSGGVAEMRTSVDGKLAELNKRLLETTIAYGRGGAGLRAKVASMETMGAGAAADRAAFAARSKVAVSGEGDLIGHIGTMGKGAGGVNAMPAAELPPALAAMAPAAREKLVADKLEERAKVMAEIKDLAAKRDAELSHAARKSAAGFDDHVKKAMKEETAGMLSF
jgi:hypothetical protein